MRRRQLLALAVCGLAAAAGCSGQSNSGSDPATDTPTATPTATPTETPEEETVDSVTVDALQPGLIELNTPDSIGVSGVNTQYIFLDVIGGDTPPARSELAFVLDGTAHAPMEETRGVWRVYNAGEDERYSPTSPGWVLFELPATADDPDSARLTWPGGERQPPAPIRERIATPAPPFEVNVEVSDTVPVGETPEMRVTVENTGSVAGRFLMAINRAGPYIAYMPEDAVRLLVEPGEQREWTGEASLFRPEEVSTGDATTLKFDWLGGEASHEVEFVAQ
jgi:hypothetical protein